MLWANALQAQVVMPTWVGTVTAVSLGIIALSFVSMAVGLLIAIKAGTKQLARVSNVVQGLENDLMPAFRSIREMTEKGKDVADLVKNEAVALARTSRAIRRRTRLGVERIEERLQDLDALYEVVHEELEEAALELATVVRTVRTGGGWLGRIRRFLPGGRRRR
jgi:hypothetical protein